MSHLVIEHSGQLAIVHLTSIDNNSVTPAEPRDRTFHRTVFIEDLTDVVRHGNITGKPPKFRGKSF